jgi:hypothetical protein
MNLKIRLVACAAAAALAALIASPGAEARGGSSGHSTSHATSSARVTTSRTHTPAYVARDSRGRIKRSEAARDEFKRQHPCPSTGRATGACPGYVIDHVTALKRGGADAPSNMQWQTIKEAKAEDKIE